MSQQINLLDPMFRPRRILMSAARVLMFLGAVLLLLAAVHAYQRDQVAQLNRDLQGMQDKVKVYQEQSNRMKKAAAGVPQPAVEAEISKLEAELKSQQDNMTAVQSGAIGDRYGFAEYLRAFSRQTVNGLWLTGFSIAGGKGDITIRGRVTDAALLPDYIQRLNSESALRGRSFAALEMRRPARAASDRDGKADSRPTPYLDFRLASTEQSDDARSAARRDERAP